MASRAPIMIEHEADLKARLPRSGKAVFDAESYDGVVAVMSPPVAADFAFVVVKPRMMRIPVVFVMILVMMSLIVMILVAVMIILRIERAAVEQHEKRRNTHSHPPTSLHSESLQFE